MSDENLTQLLAKRAPKPRAKSTTVLTWLLILLIGVLLGGAMGRGAASLSTPGAPGGEVRGSVTEVGETSVTVGTGEAGRLVPGDEVVILKAPGGSAAPVSP